MVALADFLIHNLGLNPKLVDCDLANKTFGSLSHVFKGTPKSTCEPKPDSTIS